MKMGQFSAWQDRENRIMNFMPGYCHFRDGLVNEHDRIFITNFLAESASNELYHLAPGGFGCLLSLDPVLEQDFFLDRYHDGVC